LKNFVNQIKIILFSLAIKLVALVDSSYSLSWRRGRRMSRITGHCWVSVAGRDMLSIAERWMRVVEG